MPFRALGGAGLSKELASNRLLVFKRSIGTGLGLSTSVGGLKTGVPCALVSGVAVGSGFSLVEL